MDAPTVANMMAEIIIDFESPSTISNKPEPYCNNPDPDDIFYSEDEIFHSDEEEDAEGDDEQCDGEDHFDYEELCQWKKLKKIKKECLGFIAQSKHEQFDRCRCGLGKQICSIMDFIFGAHVIRKSKSCCFQICSNK